MVQLQCHRWEAKIGRSKARGAGKGLLSESAFSRAGWLSCGLASNNSKPCARYSKYCT